MAKEYKFMFDKRFDEDEPPEPAREDLSKVSVDGIPSISQLLDTLNEKMAGAENNAPSAPEKNEEPPVPETPLPDETADETPVAETAEEVSESGEDAEEDTDYSAPESEDVSENAPDGEAPFSENEPQQPETEEPVPENDQPEEETAQSANPQAENVLRENAIPAPSALPVFTEDQLKAAEEKAREEGRLNGMEEGREAAWQEAMVSLEKQNSDTLISIDSALKNVMGKLEGAADASFSTAVDFAMAVCKKALPALCATNAVEEIRSLLEDNLRFLKDEPKISLCLNPFLADRIKPALADLVKKEAYSGKIAIIRDDSVNIGDCRVEWKNGGLEKNIQDILNHTEELVKLYNNHAVPTDAPSDKHGEEQHG